MSFCSLPALFLFCFVSLSNCLITLVLLFGYQALVLRVFFIPKHLLGIKIHFLSAMCAHGLGCGFTILWGKKGLSTSDVTCEEFVGWFGALSVVPCPRPSPGFAGTPSSCPALSPAPPEPFPVFQPLFLEHSLGLLCPRCRTWHQFTPRWDFKFFSFCYSKPLCSCTWTGEKNITFLVV